MTNTYRFFGLVFALSTGLGCNSRAGLAAEQSLAEGDRPPTDRGDTEVSRADPGVGPTMLSISPEDLMTAVRGTVPSVIVLDPYPSEETLAAIEDAIEIVTWPEGDPVAASIVRHAAEPERGLYQHRFDLIPTQSLEPRWHAVRVDLTGVSNIAVTGEPVTPSVWVSRFRPDSQPILRSVSIGPGDDGFEVLIRFSERVRDQRRADEVVSVFVRAERLACTTSGDSGLSGEDGAAEVALICPSRPFDAEFTVRLDPGLRGFDRRTPVGVAFGSSEHEFSFNPARDPRAGASERIFRPGAR